MINIFYNADLLEGKFIHTPFETKIPLKFEELHTTVMNRIYNKFIKNILSKFYFNNFQK